MGLYQRNLTNFTQTPIYENNRSYDSLQKPLRELPQFPGIHHEA